MKYTNIKKLLIKFMGGGLINFPTRFLRWIKIDGDAEGDDGGGSGGDDSGGSMSMYDAWMKAFDGFKIVDNGVTLLDVAPALINIKDDGNYYDNTADSPIPLTFMNSQTSKYYEYREDSETVFYDIKDTPDNIYDLSKASESSFPLIRFLYDLDELNQKANNLTGGVDSLFLNRAYYGQICISYGKSQYVPYSGVIKVNGKYYVWFPESMD